VIAVDTSVVIAAFATWHEAHGRAVRLIAQRPALPAPVALEVYAVLTRMPPPHRIDGSVVRDYLQGVFPGSPLTLPRARLARLVDDLVRLGISGAASYDAAIAFVATHHGCQLATLDRRARTTYDRVGVIVREVV
jgi:predicted nucleic acid-binding protein